MHSHTEDAAIPATSGTIVSPAAGTATNQSLTTAYDPYAARRARSARVAQAIYLIFAVIGGMLLLRFLLRALGANPEAGFAQAVYASTGVLVAPFSGLFGTSQMAGGAALEMSTLVALIVYAGVGWLLVKAAWLIFGESRSSTVASVSSKQTRAG